MHAFLQNFCNVFYFLLFPTSKKYVQELYVSPKAPDRENHKFISKSSKLQLLKFSATSALL